MAGVMAMGERIAALVLPRLSASAGGRLSPVRGAPLPVAELLGLPRAGSLRYGMARVDADGRVSNRSTIAALGWCGGDPLHITLLAGSVVVHRHSSGVFRMPTKPYVVVLPAPVRKRSGMRAGEQVLIAADPTLDVLVVHPLSALDSMITAYHASLVDGGDGDDTRPSDALADGEVLDAARVLLARMGVNPADLLTAQDRPPLPTFTAYIPIVSAAVSAGTRGTYGSYWKRLEDRWGNRTLLEPTPSEILQLAEEIKATAVVRRNSRGGRNTAENFIAALRCLYRHAERDGLITEADNPALKVPKPRRLPSTRRALGDIQLADINHTATTGDDPELDAMLLRLHTETAARRGGAINLRPRDLDPDQCLILLREKGETVRWQPVSPTLMTHLLAHTEERGADDRNGPLLRYRHGEPITYRRYDHLWDRLGRYLPWVATQNVSTHWLRHTTLTWVERNFGYAVAHAFAGHSDHTDSATLTYVKATLQDVATALAALTGEPHPLAVAP